METWKLALTVHSSTFLDGDVILSPCVFKQHVSLDIQLSISRLKGPPFHLINLPSLLRIWLCSIRFAGQPISEAHPNCFTDSSWYIHLNSNPIQVYMYYRVWCLRLS